MNIRLRILFLGFAMSVVTALAQESVYTWSPTGSLRTARHSGCAVSLADGRVLVAGGEGSDGVLNTVEIYGPEGAFAEVAPMAFGRSRHTCTQLGDGRVLVVGGRDAAGAEIYDPAADQWTAAVKPGLTRWGHTASLLPDGRVLLAGGETPDGTTDTLEVFDPRTNGVEPIEARLVSPRKDHSAAVLADGRVLIAGSADGIVAVDVFRPEDNTVASAAPLPSPRASHTAVTLLDGRVLVAGGRFGDSEMASTLLYNPETDFWDAGAEMSVARGGHVAVLIPNNGGVLLIGGSSGGAPTGSTELFDPAQNRMVEVGGLTAARVSLVAAAVGEDGEILAVGGLAGQGPVAVCGTLLAPTVRPNKTIFIEGETVTLTGRNWRVDSPVRLVIGQSQHSLSVDNNGTFIQTQHTVLARGLSIRVNAFQQISGTTTTLSASASYAVAVSTSASLAVTPAGSAQVAAPVVLLAEIRPASSTRDDGSGLGPIRGRVKFFSGNTLLGEVTSDSPDFQRDVNEFAFVTFRTASLPAGGHSLRAQYEGNSFYGSSEALKVNYAVTKRSPQVSLTVSPRSPRPGDAVTLTAVVTGNVGPPSGTLRFRVDRQFSTLGVSGDAVLTPTGANSATATFSTTLSSAGAFSLGASYLGNATYDTAVSETSLLTVTRLAPTLTPVGGSTTVALFDSGRYAANLDFTGNVVPTGRVFLDIDGVSVSSMEVSAAAAPSPTRRVIELTPAFTGIGLGQRVVRFRYEGDTRFEPANAAPQVTVVTKGVVSISIQFPPSIIAGQQISLVLRVVSQGTVATRPAPTGSIQMFIDTVARQTLMLSPSTIQATASTANFTLTRGMHSFTITYSGDANYNGKVFEITREAQ